MRRVSSRQRLVSWDDNDGFGAALESNVEEEDSFYSEPPIITSTVAPTFRTSKAAQFLAAITKKRKRRAAAAHLIPPESDHHDIHLPNDIWCQIHTFLDKKDVQSILCTNQQQRRMVFHHKALWTTLLYQQWPWIPQQQQQHKFHFSPRTLVRHRWSPTGPTGIDTSKILLNTSSRHWSITGTTARYTGSRHGDRCLRANRPWVVVSPSCRQDPLAWRPTLCRDDNNNNNNTINIIRMLPTKWCWYFEITIHAAAETTTTAAANDTCIAIGVATDLFSLRGRQPGWDQHSYGWHGDDGGLFHGAGSMRGQPLETFGPGDTVGCGIVPSSSSSSSSCGKIKWRLCCTKNGRYLGAPFVLPSQHKEWYPVVGIDAPHAVSCNFGTEPFVYDIQEAEKDAQHRSSSARVAR